MPVSAVLRHLVTMEEVFEVSVVDEQDDQEGDHQSPDRHQQVVQGTITTMKTVEDEIKTKKAKKRPLIEHSMLACRQCGCVQEIPEDRVKVVVLPDEDEDVSSEETLPSSKEISPATLATSVEEEQDEEDEEINVVDNVEDDEDSPPVLEKFGGDDINEPESTTSQSRNEGVVLDQDPPSITPATMGSSDGGCGIEGQQPGGVVQKVPAKVGRVIPKWQIKEDGAASKAKRGRYDGTLDPRSKRTRKATLFTEEGPIEVRERKKAHFPDNIGKLLCVVPLGLGGWWPVCEAATSKAIFQNGGNNHTASLANNPYNKRKTDSHSLWGKLSTRKDYT